MPAKKKVQEEEPPMLMGRLSTNIKIGIVGLPNVGLVLYIYISLLVMFSIMGSAAGGRFFQS